MLRAEFPEKIAEEAEEEFGVGGREVQTADEAAGFFFDGGVGVARLGRG